MGLREPLSGQQRWSDAEDARLLTMQRQGLSYDLIAKRLDRTKGSIKSRLQQMAKAPQRPAQPSRVDLDMLRAENDARTAEARAKRFGPAQRQPLWEIAFERQPQTPT
jgi:hypothetical protein